MTQSLDIDAVPRAVAAASPRLPRRLDYYSEHAPVVLVGMNRGHELLDFTPLQSLRLIVISGRVAVSNALASCKFGRFGECELSRGQACSIRALETCDLLLVECDAPAPLRRDAIAPFFAAPSVAAMAA